MTSPRHVARVMRRELNGSRFLSAPWQWGVVDAVHTSPATVDLYLDGSSSVTLGVRYLPPYSPTAGDTVLVGRHGPDRFVLGSLDPAASGGGTAPTWTTPTITNATTPTGAQAVRYCKDSLGWVHIEGVFKVGSSNIAGATTLFTLPTGYRPAATVGFGLGRTDTPTSVEPGTISTSGAVSNSYIGASSGGTLLANSGFTINVSFYVGT